MLVFHGLGSGKTLTSIAGAAQEGGNIEVITPASLRGNFSKEVDKHTRKGIDNLRVESFETRISRNKKLPKNKPLIVDENMMDKIGEYFVHQTHLNNIDKILESGKIKSIASISKKNQEAVINVERNKGSKSRFSMKAREALEAMKKNGKTPNSIFLTKGGKQSSYGDFLIVKKLKIPKKHTKFNLIPNEYTTTRDLSVKRNATIYAPTKLLKKYKKKYKDITFKDSKDFKLRSFDWRHYPLGGYQKIKTILEEKMASDISDYSDKKIKREFGVNSFLSGSTPLGINIDNSDIDILSIYKKKGNYLRAINRFSKKYPQLKSNKWSDKKENKKVLTGTIGGQEIDLVVAWGDKPNEFAKKYKEIKKNLGQKKRDEIKNKKLSLKNSWLFPETRYKKYKKQVAKNLGLEELYF